MVLEDMVVMAVATSILLSIEDTGPLDFSEFSFFCYSLIIFK